MGVMSCNRTQCENIMCDTYITRIGYICRECQEEFKKYLKKQDKENLTEIEILEELEIFMESIKRKTISDGIIDVDDFFNNYTK